VLISVGFLAGVALLPPVLGFFPAAVLLLITHMLFPGIRSPLTIVVVCVALLGVAWALFQRLHDVPLPHGMLF
jgi:uncharacterized membrane protein YqjE